MTFEWEIPQGGAKWVKERTFYLTKHGSHAYGTNLPTSDLDIRGICVAPREYYLGYDLRFEQTASPVVDEANDAPDFLIFEIRKFMKLSAVCNPNALEILFTDPSDHLLVTPMAEMLFANKNLFLNRLAQRTFSGYAASQMHRIEGHYRWLKNPPKGKPERTDLKLPPNPEVPREQMDAIQAAIRKKLDHWQLGFLENLEPAYRIEIKEVVSEQLAEMRIAMDDLWVGAARSLGCSDNFIELLAKERTYTARMREWKQYQDWLRKRNPARAELEAKWGYDTKHAMHLVRLMRMCRELLTEGVLRVRRADAEELLDVRRGAWGYEALVDWFDVQNKELAIIALTSPLPPKPDNRKLNALCVAVVEASFQQ
jgi:predicted nucleotidyltransferase